MATISNKIAEFLQNRRIVQFINEKISMPKRHEFFGKKMFFGIRIKLVISFLLISIGPLLLCTVIIINNLSKSFSERTGNEYLRRANIWVNQLSPEYFTNESERTFFNKTIDTETKREMHENDKTVYRLFVFDTKCNILFDSNGTATNRTYVVPEVLSAFANKTAIEVYKENETIYVASRVMNGKNVIGAVLIVASANLDFAMLDEITRNLILIIGMVGIIVTFLVFFNTKIIISPLKNFLEAVERISEGRFDERIELKGHDEFTMLAESFNNMTEQLERVEKTREEFVSNVSHELKTPLSSMKVLSDAILIQEDVDMSVYKEFLQDINSEVDRMTNIINDLLNVVKLNQGESGLNIQSIDLLKMVTDILKRLFPLAEQKKIKIILNEVKQKIVVDLDEVKMTLAVSNLIENAIKYTEPEGIVKISLEQDHMHAFISIQDTGLGISEEDQTKVFNRFYRVDKTRDRETGGTGLGLAITHSTVLIHNGSIKLTSKLGEGSTFLIRIPLTYQANIENVKKSYK